MADNSQKDPRRWVSGDNPMTGAQEAYLKALCEAAHQPVPTRKLTTAEALEIIDRLKDETGIGPSTG
jgi:hypothetical protein